jgi:5-dehydro-2-deoxygluconokinase
LRPLDLICLGRAAVDLYGEQLGAPLEDMSTFKKALGGCAANVAVGAARLGLRTAMLTRVGDEQMGRFVRKELAREGVDVSHVRTDGTRLTALALLALRGPASFPLLFYRESCADLALTESDFDEAFIGSAQALLLTGTHLSRADVERVSHTAAGYARKNGTKVVLDLDYRPVLWGLTGHGRGEERFVAAPAVTRVLQRVLGACDLVTGTEEEVHIAGGVEDTVTALQAMRAHTAAPIVLKRGPQGCVVFEGEIPPRVDDGCVVPGFCVDVLNVLGAGDAFLSGLLWGWLRGEGLEQAAQYGNAAGAMVVTRHLCAPEMPAAGELRAFMASRPRRADDDPAVRTQHRLANRRGAWPELCVLAFDHRAQLEDAAKKCGAPLERLPVLKALLARAARKAGAHGMIVDDRYGATVLASLTGEGLWLARPVEKPQGGHGGAPLELETGPLQLRTWPREHIVKCLAFPDPGTFAADEVLLGQLAQVQAWAHETDHELLIELIPRRGGGPVEHSSLPKLLEVLYARGVAPDWWKLPAMPRGTLWRELDALITRLDPSCRGIVVLGMNLPEAHLSESFKLTGGVEAVKGFAVGRTLWGGPATAWLEGQLTDEKLVDRVAQAFERLVQAWRQR